MSNIKYLFVIVMLFILLCSCTKGEIDLKVKISLPDKNLIDLVSITYSDQELLDIVQFNGTIKDFNEKYPVECVRKIHDIYRIAYLGKSNIVIIAFDNYGKKIFGNIYQISQEKSDFSNLVIGQSLDDVKKIDPNGEYLFLYTGRNDTPRVSSHYTNDGYLITIEYDNLNMILSINEELI